ncbi:response regulator [Luteimicrobium subarcticum]|uniref:LuxR family two component transcriptional regulator n=1 Tax=Luteimicrobium subarcticum TaxID=620910 RepID=A0A2M8W6P3_9MICO|nr:response regulator transcription factor [Luteimicrobium subarcticum]PJI86562.1 LuxR family two component transcriptional regulator [Luteimicrobium subarcticum]
MIRVVVVDDEPLFRDGIAALLDDADDIDVVGRADDGDVGLDVVLRERPDVVLTDMQMPGRDGLELTRDVVRLAPGAVVVVLTHFQDDRYVVPALRAGAAGYLLKDSTAEELRQGVRAAAAGEAILSPVITRKILDALVASDASAAVEHASEARTRVAVLSDREREVLGEVARGASNAEIARALYMAEPTVKAHLSHALAKLGLVNRTQAAILAHEAGLDGGGEPVDR